MRKFKFRAWDDKNKEWLLGYELENLGGFSLFGECIMMGEWERAAYSFIMRKDGKSFEDLKVMQYTGLKDENSTEIYEGDILKFTYWWFDGSERESVLTGVVGFDNASFTLEQINNSFFENYTGYDKGEGKLWLGELRFSESDCEVIGNIHENPELLNE